MISNTYQSAFEEFLGGQQEASWLRRLRRSSMDRFGSLGLPTTRQEEWRYTNVAPLADMEFEPGPSMEIGELECKFREAQGPHWGTHRLVFVNGLFAPALSSVGNLPKSVVLGNVSEALRENPQRVQSLLETADTRYCSSFAFLNTAFVQDGAFVLVPRGVRLQEPLHLLFFATTPHGAAMSHPRNIIVAEESSEVSIVESYMGPEDEVYFTNAMTQLVVGRNAQVDHYKLQRESRHAYHISTFQIQQQRDSRVSSHSISLGGRLVRNDVHGFLEAEGAGLTLNGLAMTQGTQHVDNHTLIDHQKPHGSSRELYVGVLDGKSRSVFDGRILVRPDAQKTDSEQTNKNLLLSKDALANTKPQLEIYADDVKCKHGATTGQLDPNAIFYLRSRGIAHGEARNLLTYAFANEAVEKIRVAPLRDWLGEVLLTRLAG